jgi:replication-associated recombination protein RarA
MNLVLHPRIRARVDEYIARPSSVLLMVGPTGSGKRFLALSMSAQLLQVPVAALAEHPYMREFAPAEQSLGIEDAQAIQQYVSRRVTSERPINRIALISQADRLTLEAQNALLKLLEEPPSGTIILLTATSSQSVLTTIRSRSQTIMLQPPLRSELESALSSEGHSSSAIHRALLMSGDLPGLTLALLHSDTTHPLIEAAQLARDILQQSTFHRLVLVDQLTKQKELFANVLFVLSQMAHVSLTTAASKQDTSSIRRWQAILTVTYTAQVAIAQNTQPKLVLTNLMLTL